MERIIYNVNNQQNTENTILNTSEEAKKTYLETLLKKNSSKIGDSHDIIITQDKLQEITAYTSPSLKKSYQIREHTIDLEDITPQIFLQSPKKTDKRKKRATNEDTNLLK